MNKIAGVRKNIKLSAHFFTNWQKRVGPTIPTPELIWEIITDPGVVIVECGKAFRLSDGSIYNTLTRIWNPALQMIISIDNIKNVAVSVITPTGLKN